MCVHLQQSLKGAAAERFGLPGASAVTVGQDGWRRRWGAAACWQGEGRSRGRWGEGGGSS